LYDARSAIHILLINRPEVQEQRSLKWPTI